MSTRPKMKMIPPVAVVILAVWAGIQIMDKPSRPSSSPATQPAVRRIVSLAPSITESLFTLGLGDRVVGVTRYDRYPPAVKEIEKIGGFLDPNFEAILRLNPDLVLMCYESRETIDKLHSLGLRTFVARQQTIPDILDAMIQIGHVTGTETTAVDWVQNARNEMKRLQNTFEHVHRPRVLVSMTRSFGEGAIREVYAAGRNTFYNDLIELAGGVNACGDSLIKVPSISAEGIITLNPDVIIDLVSESMDTPVSAKTAEADWQTLPEVAAVKNHCVRVLTSDYIVIPGPRFLKTLNDFAVAIHPEICQEVRK